MIRRFHLFILGIFLIGLSACRTSNIGKSASACLWMQHSAEYDALASSVYYSAISNLSHAIEDSFWTAAPHHQKMDFYKLPPAVVLDVDATILDNSAYYARKIEQNKNVDPEDWQQWVREAKATPVPGGPEFTRIADGKGVTVFYVTNRDISVEEATRKNLAKFGFPLNRDKDVILSKNEREEWTSDKSSRRDYIAREYRIIMMVGDDLTDFISAEELDVNERKSIIRKQTTNWGRKWFMLPNPVYGSWELALEELDKEPAEDKTSVISNDKTEIRAD